MDDEQILTHIATIHDLDDTILLADKGAPMTISPTEWVVRIAARCLVVDPKTNEVALQRLDTEGVIKLPGGGLQYTVSESGGESFLSGVTREIAEETGIDATKMKLSPLGITIEYRKKWKFVQISYCYMGEHSKNIRESRPSEDGSHLLWAESADHALELIRSYQTSDYDKQFMRLRDQAIVKYFLENN